jgi:endonuclease YncB( thermonuclease family)
MIQSNFIYRAWLKRVIDADTLELFIFQADYGFKEYKVTVKKIRLKGIDCWESRHTDREHKIKGLRAKRRVQELCNGRWLRVHTYKDEMSFTRWIGSVFYTDKEKKEHSLVKTLREEGHEKVLEGDNL